MPVPMTFNATLKAFRSPLPIHVYDCEGQYIDGVWEWGEKLWRTKENGDNRKIRAIALQITLQIIQFYKEGTFTNGGIALLTKEPFTVSDIADGGEQNIQSFVTYQGYTFRVVGDGFISAMGIPSLVGNAKFKCYHCARYIE